MTTARDLFDAALISEGSTGPAERAHRDAMRAALLRTVDRGRRIRRLRSAAVAVALAAAVVVSFRPRDVRPPPPRVPSATLPAPIEAPVEAPIEAPIEIVRDRREILTRLRIEPPPTSRIEIVPTRPLPAEALLDDATLVGLLLETGRPAVAIRTSGRFFLSVAP